MSLPGTTAGSWAQQLFTEGGSPRENQAGKGKGQKESRKTSKSKMKRFKGRVRVGSRKTGWEAVSTEWREQRRQITICLCTYPETEGLQGKGKLCLQDTALRRVSCPWCSTHSVSPKKQSQRFRSSAQSCFICSQITVWLQNLFDWGFVFLC